MGLGLPTSLRGGHWWGRSQLSDPFCPSTHWRRVSAVALFVEHVLLGTQRQDSELRQLVTSYVFQLDKVSGWAYLWHEHGRAPLGSRAESAIRTGVRAAAARSCWSLGSSGLALSRGGRAAFPRRLWGATLCMAATCGPRGSTSPSSFSASRRTRTSRPPGRSRPS